MAAQVQRDPVAPARPAPAPRRHALVASRICHDLVGPLGAIANGLELMDLAGDGSPEAELMAESVADALARVRFFRLAYGFAAPGQAVARAEITGTLRAVSRGGRMSYDWQVPGDGPREMVRAVFLLLQCMESAMPSGGHVRVTRSGDAWEVTGDGRVIRIDEAMWRSLQDPHAHPPPEAPSHIQFALLPEVLTTLGRPLALKLDRDRIVARL